MSWTAKLGTRPYIPTVADPAAKLCSPENGPYYTDLIDISNTSFLLKSHNNILLLPAPCHRVKQKLRSEVNHEPDQKA